MKPPLKRIKLNPVDEPTDDPAPDDPGPDVIFADDDPFSFYALVLTIDEAAGGAPQHDRIVVDMDAAYVTWYRQQIDMLAFPPVVPALNTVAMASGVRLLELVLTVPEFQRLDQVLTAANQPLEDSSWWLITPFPYGLRATVRVDVFFPALFSQDPATVVTATSRQQETHLLPRLIIPRSIFRQRLFAMRELF
jgi:hypothetical protein